MGLLPEIEEIEKKLKEPKLGYKTLKWSNLLMGSCPLCSKILVHKGKQMVCTSTKGFERDCWFAISIYSYRQQLLNSTNTKEYAELPDRSHKKHRRQ